ncbi:hypothetical protein BJ508DRAFT_314230 [Ascobolus immersus RN42]|uniref:OTU domain-containing protein n=1 Tax=Ascobolus immersus RN42 TaxID=1160509 RepID=A0A3N4HFQ8_ASCIM|nr:hypothetical protein BJ508DRAFT_314230 [Ascobolus immersus RN42]
MKADGNCGFSGVMQGLQQSGVVIAHTMDYQDVRFNLAMHLLRFRRVYLAHLFTKNKEEEVQGIRMLVTATMGTQKPGGIEPQFTWYESPLHCMLTADFFNTFVVAIHLDVRTKKHVQGSLFYPSVNKSTESFNVDFMRIIEEWMVDTSIPIIGLQHNGVDHWDAIQLDFTDSTLRKQIFSDPKLTHQFGRIDLLYVSDGTIQGMCLSYFTGHYNL